MLSIISLNSSIVVSINHCLPPNHFIIHAGGIVECYCMAFPAAWIIHKYPNFVLTRPEIFRRPWDSVVPPEEILVPGRKYFVVPILTLKKLRRRMLKSTVEISDNLVCEGKDTVSSKSLCIVKHKPANRRVRFKRYRDRGRFEMVNLPNDLAFCTLPRTLKKNKNL